MVRKVVELNAPQGAVIQALRMGINRLYLEWGRGTGKSTILGWCVKEAVYQLPRATGILVGQTYTQILSRTLPSTKEGLEMFGLYEDVDYVVGKCGKSLGFEMPFQSPNQWKNSIHFRNGFVLVLVSLDNPNSGRGLNSAIVVGDEAALMDPERLFNNVQTTNRVNKIIYRKSPLLNAEIYASSTPLTQEGKWFTDMERKIIAARQGKYDLPGAEKYAFIKANAKWNEKNLSADWYDRMRVNSPSQMHYDAEILNIRPPLITNSFYPQLDPVKHYYEAYNVSYLENISVTNAAGIMCKQDGDLAPSHPLIVSMDWGVFNSMLVIQDTGAEVRHLKSLWVKSPQIIDDLILEFIEYYRPHDHKEIYFYYDRNGNSRQANSRLTLAEQATEVFHKHGWTVIPKTINTLDPRHNDKYIVGNYMLQNGGTRGLPRVTINRHNCHDLTVSLENAPAKEGKNGVEKNKLSERSTTIPQQHATHLSDAFDLYLYWKYKDAVRRLMQGGRFGSSSIPLTAS